MKPEFARAVDPVFLYVLDLLERIERNEMPNPVDERLQICGRVDQAEHMLGSTPEWQLAKYGLSAWVDEVLVDAPWDAREWWEGNSLEFHYFSTHERQWMFYTKAKEATALTKKDALEVYYVAVVLGFRGLYGIQTDAILLQQADLPPDLESWARRVSSILQLKQGRPPILETPRPLQGASPLEGKFNLVGMVLAFVCLLAGTIVLGGLLFVVFP